MVLRNIFSHPFPKSFNWVQVRTIAGQLNNFYTKLFCCAMRFFTPMPFSPSDRKILNLFGSDGYRSYYADSSAGVLGSSIPRDGDIGAKEYVVGVRLGEEARAYPFSALNKEPVVNDVVNNVPVVVFFDKTTASGTVFSRVLDDGRVVAFQSGETARFAIDDKTGSQWGALTGLAVDGVLTGTQLKQVPVTYAFWFGWSDYHEEGTVYLGQN